MADVESKVRCWAESLLGTKVSIYPLHGGANNHVFHCIGLADELVIKHYRKDDPRVISSRRAAEVALLRAAAESAPHNTPKLLAVNAVEDMIAVSFVSGDSFCESSSVSEADVWSLMDFYGQLNSEKVSITDYSVMAREGYLSISEHIKSIEKRLSALTFEHVPPGLHKAAQSAFNDAYERFESVKRAASIAIVSGSITDKLPKEHLQISPGDFGFHNAIKTPKGLVAIDFEYAGLDDPAKTLADFFLQPKVRVDVGMFDQVASRMAIAIPLDILRHRVSTLGRLLSIKWLTIILAPFKPDRYPSFTSRYHADVPSSLMRRIELAQKKTFFE